MITPELYELLSKIIENQAEIKRIVDELDAREVSAGSGAVDSVNGYTGTVVLDPDDLDDSATTNKFTTAGDISKLAGIEALADVTDANNIAAAITGSSTDDTIVDADVWGYLTGGALVKTAWSNIKAVLKTYFDTLYVALTGNQTVAGIKTFTDRMALAVTTTTGAALSVIRDLAAASTDSPVASIVQDNASDDQAALYVQQDGSGAVIVGYDGATKVFELSDGGTLSVYTVIKALSASGIQFQDDGGNVGIFIKDGGNVGIKSATADYPLHLVTIDGGAAMVIDASATAYNATSGILIIQDNLDRQCAFSSIGLFRRDADVDNAAFAINFQGYNGGTTRYRDLNVFDGKNTSVMFVDGSTGSVGIGPTSPAAKLHVDQSSTTGAVPVLLLDQADLSEEFIEFTGTVGAGNSIDTAAVGTYYGKIRVNITGVGYKYIPLYNT